MQTPTTMAMWLFEPWLWDDVVIADAGVDEAGTREGLGWLALV